MEWKERLASLGYFAITMFLVSYGLLLVVKGYLTNLLAARVRRSRTPPSGMG